MCFRERIKATEPGNRVKPCMHCGSRGKYLFRGWNLPTFSTLQLSADRIMTQQELGETLPSREDKQPALLALGGYQEWLKPATHSGPRPEISNLSEVILAIWPT